MKEKIIAKRYAEAFAGYTQDAGTRNTAVKDLIRLKSLLRENPDFMSFLTNPEISMKEKNDFLDAVLKDDYAHEVRQFLKILLDKRRITLLVEIIDYIRLHYARPLSMNALVKSTYPLDSHVIEIIRSKLESRFKKKMNFYLEFDPSLLGGIQITLGNTIIDGSVLKQLGELKEKLKTIKV